MSTSTLTVSLPFVPGTLGNLAYVCPALAWVSVHCSATWRKAPFIKVYLHQVLMKLLLYFILQIDRDSPSLSHFYSTFTLHLLHLYPTFTPFTTHEPQLYPTYTLPLPNLYVTFTAHLLHLYSIFPPLLPHLYPTFACIPHLPSTLNLCLLRDLGDLWITDLGRGEPMGTECATLSVPGVEPDKAPPWLSEFTVSPTPPSLTRWLRT